jgi:hypothetical protein
MVARNRIRCTVVAVPVSTELCASRGALTRELLPWADPYVAQLIKNLQDEVRRERRERSLVRHHRSLGTDGAVLSTSRRISAVR